ncbi:MAG: mechanosensitive ion channel family protein, partial [Acidobacteriota bacterium]|nr:mechanosensitive ion channel family protein [Acidobacteriota bacterium]
MTMDILVESLRSELDALLRITPRIAVALFVVVASILIGKGLSRVVGRVLTHARLATPHKSFFRRATVWVAGLLGVVVGLNILGLKAAASGLLAGGGITAVVLGFAFREIGENFLAGILLAFKSPFRVDDIIESGDFKGTVRGIEIRHTHIRTSDGRDIFIPNSQIVNKALVNFTR